VVCPAIVLLSGWLTRSEGHYDWPPPKLHVRVRFGSILAAEALLGQRVRS